jgi:phospholipid N-methyltransferase
MEAAIDEGPPSYGVRVNVQIRMGSGAGGFPRTKSFLPTRMKKEKLFMPRYNPHYCMVLNKRFKDLAVISRR